VGWMLPLIMIFFLVLRFIYPPLADKPQSGVLFYSLKGPGSMYAPLAVSLIIGLAVGFLAREAAFAPWALFVT